MPGSSKKWYVIGSIVLIVLVGSIARWKNSSKGPVYEFATASTGTVLEQVSVTGNVVPAQKVDLSFEKGGKVASVPVTVGQTVKAGQELVLLANSDIIASLRQAQATVQSAKALATQYAAVVDTQTAKLEELRRGTRAEELAVAELDLVNAKQSEQDAVLALTQAQDKAVQDLANVSDTTKDVMNSAATKADDAVSYTIADLFVNNTATNPQLSFATEAGLKATAESGRINANGVVAAITTRARTLPMDVDGRLAALSNTLTDLGLIQNFLGDLTAALNASSANVSAYKGDVVTARTTINTATDAVRTQIQAIQNQRIVNDQAVTAAQTALNTAKQRVASAESALALKQAGSTPESIRAQEAAVAQAKANVQSQEAQVKQAEAAVDSAAAQVEKTILRAPFEGLVTATHAKVGEIMGPSAPAVSLISASALEIDAYVPEIDIVKISVGDMANVTLDPYGNATIFPVTVTHIDPAETTIEGVSTYKVTFQFTDKDERVKPGMTANIDIETAKHENVVVVPGRAVKNDGDAFAVRVKQADGTVAEKEVKIGLRGSDGSVEIVSGISANDEVVISEE